MENEIVQIVKDLRKPAGDAARFSTYGSSQGVCTPGGEYCSSERRFGRIVLPYRVAVKENRKAPLVGAHLRVLRAWVRDSA
jgi:hypothetical protein